jgi:hypothetical protein
MTTSMGDMATQLTKDAVAFLHHDLPVEPRPAGWEALWAGPTSGQSTQAPRFIKKLWETRRILLNRVAAYHVASGASPGSFDGKTKADMLLWFRDHCNMPALRAQCSILGLSAGGAKDVMVSRLVEAGARPMFPPFICAWINAYGEMIAGRRAAGPLSSEEFSSPHLLNPIDSPAPGTPAPGDMPAPPPQDKEGTLMPILL